MVDKAKDFWDNLDLKTKIFIWIIVLILLIIFTRFTQNKKEQNKYIASINYKNINIENSINEGYTEYLNREKYLVLYNAVEKLWIDCKNGNVKQYYTYALDPVYKKKISKSSFTRKVNNIFENIDFYNDAELYVFRSQNDINCYILKIHTKNKDDSYIGIRLNNENKHFYIYYVE